MPNLISMFKIAEAFMTSLNLLVILKNLVVNINICNSHSVYPCSGGAEENKDPRIMMTGKCLSVKSAKTLDR